MTNPAEIEKFGHLAKEWWDPEGKFRHVQAFNKARLDVIISEIKSHFLCTDLKGLTILDIGCGAGLLCEPLAEAGASVVGIDGSAANIVMASEHAAGKDLKLIYRHCLAEDLNDEQFDVVLNTEVIEHVEHQEKLASICCQLVKPGGILVMATLNRTLRSYLTAIIGAEYVLKLLPKGTHDWKYFVKPSQISEWVTNQKLKTIGVHGLSYNPVTHRWRATRDSSVNYMLVASRPA